MNKKILITGGAGYVGSTLVRHALENDYQVRVLDSLRYGGGALTNYLNHPRFELVRGDIRDKKAVADSLSGIDAVIHLAAIVGDVPCARDPEETISINREATKLITREMKKAKVGRIVFASTCSNYGIADTSTPADENRELNPVSLYAESKIDVERFLVSEVEKDFCPTMLRFATAFGVSGRTRFDLCINSFTYEALRDRKLLVYGVDTWRPYIHVVDMSRIILGVLESPAEKVSGEIFNAGANELNHTKGEVSEMVCRHVPDTALTVIPKDDDKRSYRVGFDKLRNAIGFQHIRNVDDGIAELKLALDLGIITERDFEENKLIN